MAAKLASILRLPAVAVPAAAVYANRLTSAAAVLTTHVHTALTGGAVLLAACLLAVLVLILPARLRSRRPRRAAARHQLGTTPEPTWAMTCV